MKKNLLFLLVILAVTACQRDKSNADVNAAETTTFFAQYYVRYLQEEQQIKAHVAFYEGDSLPTARPIEFTDEVIFQGNTMQARQLPPRTVRYIYNGVGEYAQNGFTFQYQDNTGKTQGQQLQMAPIEDFSLNPGASRSKGMELVLKGASFLANESLVLLFTNLANNQVYSIEYKGLIDNPLFIAPEEMGALIPGKYQLYLVKKQTTTINAANKEITSEIEFYTKTKEVQIGK
ncbi:MAG: hypothetical protein ACK4TA_07730 [Saprospiraceae bacterium]